MKIKHEGSLKDSQIPRRIFTVRSLGPLVLEATVWPSAKHSHLESQVPSFESHWRQISLQT